MYRKKLCMVVCIVMLMNTFTSVGLWADDVIYRLANVNLDLETRGSFIGGKTRKSQLMQRLIMREGMTFASLDELETSVRYWENELNQFTVFMGNAKVTYTLGEQSGGEIPVYLNMWVQEGWNLVPLPSAKFSSDDGLSIGLRVRHYNFLGSMEPFYASATYRKAEDNTVYLDGAFDFNYLFQIKEHNYRFNWNAQGGYRKPLQQDHTLFSSGVGLASFWNFGTIQRAIAQVNFNVTQGFTLLGEMATANKDLTKYDDYYLSSRAVVGGWVNILPAVWIKNAWLRYNASIGSNVNYRFGAPVEEHRRGVNLDLNHSFSYGEVQVLASNFRRGYLVSLYNNNNFNFFRLNEYGLMWQDTPANKSGYRMTLGTEAVGYFPYKDRLAVNTRIGIEYQPWQREIADYAVKGDWASRVRGVRNEAMRGDALFYWNLELESNVWMWRFSKLFNVHGVLFFDGGMVHSAMVDRKGWQEPFSGLGVEVRLVPLFSRTLTFRASIAMNTNRWFGWDMRGSLFDIYLGQELHF